MLLNKERRHYGNPTELFESNENNVEVLFKQLFQEMTLVGFICFKRNLVKS